MTQYKAYERWLINTATSPGHLAKLLMSDCCSMNVMAFHVVKQYSKQDSDWKADTFLTAAINLLNDDIHQRKST